MELQLCVAKVCIQLTKTALMSENITVNIVLYSIMGANIKHINDKYCMAKLKEICIRLGSACGKIIKM